MNRLFQPMRWAICLMIAQAALFASETGIIHHIGSRVPLLQLAFIRSLAGMIFAAMCARGCGLEILRSEGRWLQVGRGVASLLYLFVMIYSFGNLPFSNA
ncbi:hypothetical protein, partial [Sphingomonas sp.]|uniref:hypothetical protein n=1 Tax=Sphingomonas sp. TaxID=28214 RepID=UPI00260039F4